MTLRDRVRPWAGTVYRHLAAGSMRSVLDDAYLGLAMDNRWNEAGTPTWYFSVDIGLLVAEYARHITLDLPEGQEERLERRLWKVKARIERALDLTDPATVAAMGAGPINEWALDVNVTQKTATYLRAMIPDLQALIVPSAAFLDQHERFNVVIYRDRIDLRSTFGKPEFVRAMVINGIGGA